MSLVSPKVVRRRARLRALGAAVSGGVAGAAAFRRPLVASAYFVHVIGAKIFLDAASALLSIYLAPHYSFCGESARYACIYARQYYEKAANALHRYGRTEPKMTLWRRLRPILDPIAVLRERRRKDLYTPPVLKTALEKTGRFIRDTSHWTLGLACFLKATPLPTKLAAALAPLLRLEARCPTDFLARAAQRPRPRPGPRP